jgi:hypothetical protein
MGVNRRMPPEDVVATSLLQQISYAFPAQQATQVLALMESMTSALVPQIKKQVEVLGACHGDLPLFYRALWLVLEALQKSLPVKPADKHDRWLLEKLSSALVSSAMNGGIDLKL